MSRINSFDKYVHYKIQSPLEYVYLDQNIVFVIFIILCLVTPPIFYLYWNLIKSFNTLWVTLFFTIINWLMRIAEKKYYRFFLKMRTFRFPFFLQVFVLMVLNNSPWIYRIITELFPNFKLIYPRIQFKLLLLVAYYHCYWVYYVKSDIR